MSTSTSTAVGRIISASLQAFETECFQHESVPALGALAATVDGSRAIFGAVSAIVTQGVDPSRPIAPHGTADEDLETVLSRHPQLPLLLRTTFRSTVVGFNDVGFNDEDVLIDGLPSGPPPLLARVRICALEEQYRVTAHLGFLEHLLTSSDALTDEVAAAFLRRASQGGADPRTFLLRAGRALVPLLAREPDRLASILRRIRPEL